MMQGFVAPIARDCPGYLGYAEHLTLHGQKLLTLG